MTILNTEVTIKFKFSNVCSTDDLKNNQITLQEMVEILIEKEGLWIGMMDMEDCEIISVEAKEKK